MKHSELIAEVNKDIDDNLSESDITGWLNRCLDELTPLSRKEALKIAAIDESNMYELPDDLFEIQAIRINGEEYFYLPMNDKDGKGYKVWANNLYLQPAPVSGDIEMFYYKRLSHLENSDDVPEIDPSFHDLLILYAVAHSQFMDEEPERQNDAMIRYRQRREEYESFLTRNINMIYQVRIVE